LATPFHLALTKRAPSLWWVILTWASGVDAIPARDSVRIDQGVSSMLDELRIADRESGQTMAEYAVVLGVITIAVVVTLGLLSTAIQNLLNNVIASL
jgi:Flp pilus assembly pilin Flp